MAIRRALADGRIVDFFLVVRQILETYHAGSACVPLERWRSRDCPDCGDLISADDSTA